MLSRFSCVQLFATPWTVALQAPLSMEFFRQGHWSGLPCPPPEDLPDPGIEPVSAASPELASRLFVTPCHLGSPHKCIRNTYLEPESVVCAGDKQDKEGLFPHGFYHLREEADK